MSKKLGRKARLKARAIRAIEPILLARPASLTPATSDLAPLVQRPSYRFHDPKGGVLKARVILPKRDDEGRKAKRKRFDTPAMAPVTPASFDLLKQQDAATQYLMSHLRAVRGAAMAKALG